MRERYDAYCRALHATAWGLRTGCFRGDDHVERGGAEAGEACWRRGFLDRGRRRERLQRHRIMSVLKKAGLVLPATRRSSA